MKIVFNLNKATRRDRSHLVKVATQVQGKTGQYSSHRWINPNKAMNILKEELSKQGLKNTDELSFKDKKTGQVINEKELMDRMEKENFKGTLQEYAKQYKIVTGNKKTSQTKVETSPKRDANVLGLEKPIRPKASDYDDYDDLIEARLKYREEREKYRQHIDKVVKANLEKPRQYKTLDDVVNWANSRGYIVDIESLKHVDVRAFDDYIKITDELMEKYPMVKERYEKRLEYHLRYVSKENGGDFLANATGGFDFGDSFTDYESVQKAMLESMTSGTELRPDGTILAGDMIMGDGTINNLYRHEFGHIVESTIIDKFYRKDNFEDLDIDTVGAFNKDIVETLYGKEGMSDYATVNSSELFAEGFAEYESGSNTPFARAFGELLKRWL